MDLASFLDGLGSLSAADIRLYAAGLQAEDVSVAEQVAQWQAELAIDRLLRCRVTRVEAHRANAAAHRSAQMVLDAARRNGMTLPDSDVTCVARAAAAIARGMSLSDVAEPFVSRILGRWERVAA
jgi:hypothetical protein